MIEAKNIGVKIAGKRLLHQICLQVGAGELVAVVGANGAGKSTLLRVLAGVARPAGGEVRINRQALDNWKPKALARVRGVLSQSVHLSFPMTVREIVSLGREGFNRRETAAQRRQITGWALNQVQMQSFIDRDITTLSGGEQQRVHLARVLAQIFEKSFSQTKYLLLDEPVSSLDIAQQHHLLKLVKRLTRTLPLGALVVIHDVNLAARYADRIILMKKGKIIDAGPPERVLAPETLYEVFGVHTVIRPNPVGGQVQVIVVDPSAPVFAEPPKPAGEIDFWTKKENNHG